MHQNLSTFSPHIAVLLPVYNGEKFLNATLESLAAQSYNNFTLIVCNDGSTDQSQEILNLFLKVSQTHTILLRNDLNIGPGATLSRLIEYSKNLATHVVQVAQDDVLPPSYLKLLAKKIKQGQNVLIQTRALQVNSDGVRLRKSPAPPYLNLLGKYKVAFLIANNHVSAPGMLYNQNAIHPNFFGASNPKTHDWQQSLFMSLEYNFKYSLTTNVYYRRHEESLSFSTSAFEMHTEMARTRIEFLGSNDFSKFIRSMSLREQGRFYLILKLLTTTQRNCLHKRQFFDELNKVFSSLEPNLELRDNELMPCLSNHEIYLVNKIGPSRDRSSFLWRLPCHATLSNLISFTKSTLRLLIGRGYAILKVSTARRISRFTLLRISSTGGLGAQLCALSYGLWLSKHTDRHVRIHFFEKGLSYFPIIIQNILYGMSFQIRHAATGLESKVDNESTVIYKYLFKIRNLSVGKFNLILRFFARKLRLVISSENLTLEKLQKIRAYTLRVSGYHTDWRIMAEMWPETQQRVSTLIEHDFTEGLASKRHISVHWRLGDYLNNPEANKTHGTIAPDSLIDCILNASQISGFKTVKVYSDSPDLAKVLLLDHLPGLQVSFPRGEILEDLFNMTRASVFIGSHSSISTWAALAITRHNPNAFVYLPDVWFKQAPPGFYEPGTNFKKPQEVIAGIREFHVKLD
jgi:glycosyltransferase involved in cell wall biosynthesis